MSNEDDTDPIMTVEQCSGLIMALLNGSAPESVEEPRLKAFVDWARGAILDYALVQMATKGELLVAWSEERQDWIWRRADLEPARRTG